MDTVTVWINTIGDWLECHNGAIVAVATVFIAIFTVFLAVVSRKQWQQLKRTVDSAEKLEAPYLIPELINVQDIVIDTNFFNGSVPQFTYRMRNHGRTPAIITACQDTVRFIKQLPDSEEELWRGEKLSAHGGLYIPVGVAEVPIPQERSGMQFTCRLAESDFGNLPITHDNRLYLVGRMRYQDLFGRSYTQAFCIQVMKWDRAYIEGSSLPTATWINVGHVTTGDNVFNYRKEDSA